MAKIARLEEQFAHADSRKKWAVDRTKRAMAETRELRGRLAPAERAVRAYGADDRHDKLELKAKAERLEEALSKALRQNAALQRRLDRGKPNEARGDSDLTQIDDPRSKPRICLEVLP